MSRHSIHSKLVEAVASMTLPGNHPTFAVNPGEAEQPAIRVSIHIPGFSCDQAASVRGRVAV